jgi:hypothetical protein
MINELLFAYKPPIHYAIKQMSDKTNALDSIFRILALVCFYLGPFSMSSGSS